MNPPAVNVICWHFPHDSFSSLKIAAFPKDFIVLEEHFMVNNS